MNADRLPLDQLKTNFLDQKDHFAKLEAVVKSLPDNHFVDESDVAAVVARRTGMPVSRATTAATSDSSTK